MIASAYDYERQVWVDGEEAIPLMLKQNQEHIAILESEKGQEYARFLGGDRETLLASAKKHSEDIKLLQETNQVRAQ